MNTTTSSVKKLVEDAETALGASKINDALENLSLARQFILEHHPDLQILFQKWSQRAKKDLKVPPGSQNIRISFEDPRYALSAVCVVQSKVLLVQRRFALCELTLREAYMWCPRSAQALYLLAEIVRLTSFHVAQLDEAETIFRKAIAAAGAIATFDVACDAPLLCAETDFGTKAGQREVLLMLQSDRTDAADDLLRRMQFTWRISDKVLNYAKAPRIFLSPKCSPFVRVFDNFLSHNNLDRMQHIFRSDSPFWREHDYDEMENFSRQVGYFSYLYPFRDREAKTFIEQIVDGVYHVMSKQLPELAEATVAEWWVHSRPHSCGHQMHFDSDETRIEEGGSPSHPIISCVLFVQAAGGPTLMTDQTLSGDLATEGWLVDPRLNRVLAFDSTYLHGVIPGSGAAPCEDARRLTFMVGFWRNIEAKDKGHGRYGAGQPFPFENPSLQWSQEMLREEAISMTEFNTDNPAFEVGHVRPVWEQLISGNSKNYKDFFQGF